jgi:DNA-binding NarL/FixJ family response regulator
LVGPPPGLLYTPLDGSLNDPGVAAECRAVVEKHQPDMVVIDSISAAFPQSDPSEAVPARRAIAELVSIGGTVLIVDHVSKAAIGRRPVSKGGSPPSPLGAVAKENIARSSLYLESSRDNSLVHLHHVKNSFGPLLPALLLRPMFEEDSFRFELADDAAPHRRESRSAQIVVMLREHADGLDADELGRRCGISKKTVQNQLSQLSKSGAVSRGLGGRWLASA